MSINPHSNDQLNMDLMGELPRNGLKRMWDQSTSDSYVLIDKIPVNSQEREYETSGVTFGKDPNADRYTKLHLGITKDTFEGLNGNTERLEPLPDDFELMERGRVASPTKKAEMFLERLRRGGGPFGWDAREKYQDENISALADHIAEDEHSRLFDFMSNGEHVGFCKISGINISWQRQSFEKGLNKHDAVMHFMKQENQSGFPRPIEIDKIAIFPEFMSNGHGSVALPNMMRLIFQELKENYNVIYLDTRDTNPVGTEQFYARMGVRAFCFEVLPNDLTREIEWPPKFGSDIRAIGKGVRTQYDAATGGGGGEFIPEGGATSVAMASTNDNMPLEHDPDAFLIKHKLPGYDMF